MGAAGFEVDLVHEDSETSAIPATNAAKKMVEVDKVVAIIGALSSGVTVPTADSVHSRGCHPNLTGIHIPADYSIAIRSEKRFSVPDLSFRCAAICGRRQAGCQL